MSVRRLEAREEVCAVACEVGEGPLWDVRSDTLRWVDIPRGLVHAWSPSRGTLPALDVGQPVGFVVPTGADELVAGVRDGFALIDGGGGVQLAHAVERERPHMRMNDGKADRAGRLWAGTMNARERAADGVLYRLDVDWSLSAQLAGLVTPNGIGWSPDGARMYFADTWSGRIEVFAYDQGTGDVADRRPFVEVPPAAGRPDGLTVDEVGCVWVALWQGGAVHRYTPRGELDAVVALPVAQTTSCAFGGSDGRDLFVTTASRGLDADALARQPAAGRTFACRPGVAGPPADAFRCAD